MLIYDAAGTGRSCDGEGRRVRKEVAGQATTVFVYDAFGQLAAEYGPADRIGVRYLTVDHLGSTRMVTDQRGAVVKRMDYLPFGEEYPAVGYPSSTERTGVKFTGKEKDAETGLDYFLARYFSSSQGRFTSVDAKGFSKRTLRNPQKWNKYAYVLNNPLQYVDPDGLEELKVTIRTTIPYATTWLGATYSGGRKTTTQMIVETRRMGGASPVRSLTETVHPTKLLWPVKMEATAPKSAQVDGYKYTPEGQVVTIVQDTKNPLAPVPGFLTPGVTANLDIEFDEDADWIRVTGTTSQFPSFDISVTRANGETVPVYHRDPWFNSTLLLFLPHRVDTGQVPLRRSDSEQPRKEHKNCLQNRDGTCVQ